MRFAVGFGLVSLLGLAVGMVWMRSNGSPPPLPSDGSAKGLGEGRPILEPRTLTAAQRAEGYAQMARAFAAEGDPARPTRPPEPGIDEPTSAPHPSAAPDAQDVHAEAFAAAVARNMDSPGEFAFRRTVNAFMQHNRALAEQQAEREGLTLEEIEELTYFGLMAQESQRWDDVEELVGRTLEDHERAVGEALLDEFNAEFKREMRALVASEASAGERWDLITDTEARYREAYYDLTGMNEELLDSLLAGDASRAYAPATTHPPEDAPPAEAPPAPEPRPASEPPRRD